MEGASLSGVGGNAATQDSEWGGGSERRAEGARHRVCGSWKADVLSDYIL